MARVSSEITLDSARGQTRFTLTQMDGVTAMKLLMKLSKTLGPALASAQAKLAAGDKLGGVAEIVGGLDADQYEAVQNAVLKNLVAVTGDEVDSNASRNLGVIFTGCVGELGELVLHGLKLNYSSFFEKLQGVQAAPAKV